MVLPPAVTAPFGGPRRSDSFSGQCNGLNGMVLPPAVAPSFSSSPRRSDSVADRWSSEMESHGNQNGGWSIMLFFRDRGFDDKSITEMLKRCRRLESVRRERASENWDYLKSIGIQERRLPHVISKCPKILALGLDDKIVPMVQCLGTLATKRDEVAACIAKFPHILSHSVEEKLCPLLAFFQTVGVPEKHIGKIIMVNPRLVSYSIESKMTEMVNFLAGLGLDKEQGMLGKVLTRNPFIMGYSVEKRLRPTAEFLKSIGLSDSNIQAVVMNFSEVLSRDVNKILGPNLEYLKRCGFKNGEIVSLVAGYPPILIKSIRHSLEPRITFLTQMMNRRLDEAADYPDFFRHGLKRRIELRHKLLSRKGIVCSLSEMLDCDHKKFVMKFGLI